MSAGSHGSACCDFPGQERKNRQVYAARRHNGSLCTQKQPKILFGNTGRMHAFVCIQQCSMYTCWTIACTDTQQLQHYPQEHFSCASRLGHGSPKCSSRQGTACKGAALKPCWHQVLTLPLLTAASPLLSAVMRVTMWASRPVWQLVLSPAAAAWLSRGASISLHCSLSASR